MGNNSKSRQYTNICEFCKKSFVAYSRSVRFCPEFVCQIEKNRLKSLNRSKIYLSSLKNKDKKKKFIIYNRKCLNCERKFKTKNKFIRLCDRCKNTTTYTEDDFSGGLVR